MWCPVLDRSFGWLVLRIYFSQPTDPFFNLRGPLTLIFWFGWNPSTLVFQTGLFWFSEYGYLSYAMLLPSLSSHRNIPSMQVLRLCWLFPHLHLGVCGATLSPTFVLNVGYGVLVLLYGFFVFREYLARWNNILWFLRFPLICRMWIQNTLTLGAGERVEFAGFWVEEWQDLPCIFKGSVCLCNENRPQRHKGRSRETIRRIW